SAAAPCPPRSTLTTRRAPCTWRRPAMRREPLLIAALLLAGCHRNAAGPAAKPKDEKPSVAGTVSVIHPQRQALQHVVELPGAIRADEEAAITARVAGYVCRVEADIGRAVKTG